MPSAMSPLDVYSPLSLQTLYRAVALLQFQVCLWLGLWTEGTLSTSPRLAALQGVSVHPSCVSGYYFGSDVAVLSVGLATWLAALCLNGCTTRLDNRALLLAARATAMLAVFLHPTVSSSALGLVSCQAVQLSRRAVRSIEGRYSGASAASASDDSSLEPVALLSSNPYIQCFSSSHVAAGALACITLVLYVVGLPAVTLHMLRNDKWLAAKLGWQLRRDCTGLWFRQLCQRRRKACFAVSDAEYLARCQTVPLQQEDQQDQLLQPPQDQLQLYPSPLLYPFVVGGDYVPESWFFRHVDMSLVFGLVVLAAFLPLPATLPQLAAKVFLTLGLLTALLLCLSLLRNPFKEPWKWYLRVALVSLSISCDIVNSVSRALDLGLGGPILAAFIAPASYINVSVFGVAIIVALVCFLFDMRGGVYAKRAGIRYGSTEHREGTLAGAASPSNTHGRVMAGIAGDSDASLHASTLVDIFVDRSSINAGSVTPANAPAADESARVPSDADAEVTAPDMYALAAIDVAPAVSDGLRNGEYSARETSTFDVPRVIVESVLPISCSTVEPRASSSVRSDAFDNVAASQDPPDAIAGNECAILESTASAIYTPSLDGALIVDAEAALAATKADIFEPNVIASAAIDSAPVIAHAGISPPDSSPMAAHGSISPPGTILPADSSPVAALAGTISPPDSSPMAAHEWTILPPGTILPADSSPMAVHAGTVTLPLSSTVVFLDAGMVQAPEVSDAAVGCMRSFESLSDCADHSPTAISSDNAYSRVTVVSIDAAAAGDPQLEGLSGAQSSIDSQPQLHVLPTTEPPGVLASSRGVEISDTVPLPHDRLIVTALPGSDARERMQRVYPARSRAQAAPMPNVSSRSPQGMPRSATVTVLQPPPASALPLMPVDRRRRSMQAPTPTGFRVIVRSSLPARSELDTAMDALAARDASHDDSKSDDFVQSAIPGIPVRRASVGGNVAPPAPGSASEVRSQVRRGSASNVRPSPVSETRASSAGWVARRSSLGAQRLSGIDLTRHAAWAYKVWI